MEYEKKVGNFTIGGGSMKVAGSGSVDRAVDAPDVKTKYDGRAIAKTAAKAAAASAVVLLKYKFRNRKGK